MTRYRAIAQDVDIYDVSDLIDTVKSVGVGALPNPVVAAFDRGEFAIGKDAVYIVHPQGSILTVTRELKLVGLPDGSLAILNESMYDGLFEKVE